MSKSIRVLKGEIKTPPVSREARREIGFLLRQLQEGVLLSLPHSRPMPIICARCHELRVNDAGATWRIIYRIDEDAIIIADVFEKKSRETPDRIIQNCQRRLRIYDQATGG